MIIINVDKLQVRMLMDNEKDEASQTLQVIQQGNDLYPQSVALWKEHLACSMSLEPTSHKVILDVFHRAIKKIQKVRSLKLICNFLKLIL